MAPGTLSQEEIERRNTVNINAETVTNVTSNDFPGNFVGEDHSWDAEEFKRNLQVQFHYNRPYDASFSVMRISAPIANAFRRILLATLPTIAIEHCFIYNNTSIIQDEVFAQRLGMIPFTIPQELLSRMHWPLPKDDSGERSFRDIDCMVFNLTMECTRKPGVGKTEDDPLRLYNNAHVYARDLKWHPQGRQLEWIGMNDRDFDEIPENLLPRPANPDILIAKMRPGQKVEIECYAVKGNGADHAKFSPVATATYRLMPTIKILEPILGSDAVKFQRCFIPGVVGIENVPPREARKKGGQYQGLEGKQRAVVKDAFRDTVSRECLRHDEFKDKVKLGRVRDHFIFSVESTGQYESDVLFAQSIKALKAKCADLKRDLEGIVR